LKCSKRQKVINNINSKKNRHYKGQKKRDKRTNNVLQNTKQKNWRLGNTNPTKNRGEFRCFGRISSFCSTSCTRRVTLGTNLVISLECEERNGLWLRQTHYIRGHLWHNYSIALKYINTLKQVLCCFPTKHPAWRSMNKYCFARNQDSVSEWSDMGICGNIVSVC
jgi:hypothetical protein